MAAENRMEQEKKQAASLPAMKEEMPESVTEEHHAGIAEEDVAYWGKETARELARFSLWLTGEELAVMQDIALKLKERAGRGGKNV